MLQNLLQTAPKAALPEALPLPLGVSGVTVTRGRGFGRRRRGDLRTRERRLGRKGAGRSCALSVRIRLSGRPSGTVRSVPPVPGR
jgi:hypothetical protein